MRSSADSHRGAPAHQQGLFATSLDMQVLDGIIFDSKHKTVKMSSAPFYVQIKCHGSSTKRFNPQGHSPKTIDKIRATAKQLGVPLTSIYFVVGFSKTATFAQSNILPFHSALAVTTASYDMNHSVPARKPQ